MDTWWKKFSYSSGVKIVFILMLCLAGVLGFNSLVGIMRMPSEKSYYDTYDVQHRFIAKAGYVRDWIVRYNDGNIFDKQAVSSEDITRYREADPGIETDEQAVEKIIEDRRDYFEKIQHELLSDNVNVEYYAYNQETGKVITNIETYKYLTPEEVMNSFSGAKVYLVGNGECIKEMKVGYNEYSGYYDHYYDSSSKGVKNKENYVIYTRLKDPLVAGDLFYTNMNSFNERLENKDRFYTFGLVALVLAFIGGIGFITRVGQDEKGSAVTLNLFDRIPLEIMGVGYLFSLFLWAAVTLEFASSIEDSGWRPYQFVPEYGLEGFILAAIVSVGALITLLVVGSVIKHIKNRTLTDAIWTIRMIKWLFRRITEKTLPVVAVISIILYLFINCILMLFFTNSYGFGFFVFFMMLVWFNGLVGAGLLKLAVDYKKLSKGIKDVAGGDLQAKVYLTHALPAMQETAQALNHIGEGLENAVERTLKSERFKTELITNVSHDLKTPLTSIISYIDLLKEEEIANDTAKEYIAVLDERSNRLKQLVEDLVEASKAATGNVKAELIPTRIDQLVIQSVGEYTDRLEASNLAIVFNKMEEVSALVDGRHMCRIVENLLSNVCKYAMPNTRVYIDVIDGGSSVQFIVKNISKEPLAMDPNELTERFVRGEEARSTEGSGLGLAIASSLAEVQGGKLKLEIDGDLFKAVVEMSKVG